MTTLTETKPDLGFVLTEANGRLSRDNGVIITGQNLGAATVLGRILTGAATAAIKGGGNTGNGVFTIDPTTPTLAGAKVGVYTARCIIAAANGGTFQVEDPDGNVIGQYVVGAAAFSDEIKFTIADGAADFIVGDGFDITVPAGSGKYTILAPAANDGSQIAAAILGYETNATSADVAATLITRQAEVVGDELTWPGGITTPQLATAKAQLAALGIVLR